MVGNNEGLSIRMTKTAAVGVQGGAFTEEWLEGSEHHDVDEKTVENIMQLGACEIIGGNVPKDAEARLTKVVVPEIKSLDDCKKKADYVTLATGLGVELPENTDRVSIKELKEKIILAQAGAGDEDGEGEEGGETDEGTETESTEDGEGEGESDTETEDGEGGEGDK